MKAIIIAIKKDWLKEINVPFFRFVNELLNEDEVLN